MGRVNKEMDIQSITKMIKDFTKNQEKFGMQQEMVSTRGNFIVLDE